MKKRTPLSPEMRLKWPSNWDGVEGRGVGPGWGREDKTRAAE